MTQAPPAGVKIPTSSPQRIAPPCPGQVRASGAGRPATRGGGDVIELKHGITVYPARSDRGRLRAVWHEAGRRERCEAASEEKLAAKLEKVKDRLAADAPNMTRPGADLIAHYLDPDRLPASSRWGGPGIVLAPERREAEKAGRQIGQLTDDSGLRRLPA